MRPGDFSGEHQVITGHIGLRIACAMFEFYFEPPPKLIQVDF
jgi:hypothetical protein